MDTSLLSPLQARWPNDYLPFDGSIKTQNIIKAFGQLSGSASPWDDLRMDESDGKLIADFAEANGMTYAARLNLTYSAKQPAWLGPSIPVTAPDFVHGVSGKLHGYEVVFFLEYAQSAIQKRGSDQTKLRKRGIVKVKLPKLFPQVVLDSRKNEPGYVSTFPTTIQSNQKMTLEGNFNDSFDFYAPRGLQVNTLTLLAPNFMQILMNSAATFDVEFFGDEVILATWDPLYDPAVMKSALTILNEQLTYLNNLLVSWNYQPLRQPFDTLEYARFNGEVVKVGRFRITPIGIIGIALLVYILIAILGNLSK